MSEVRSHSPESARRFQVLALSGGGYRGLYTAQILADLEAEIGEPIGRHFDLIAGTSVGGILALAIAMEIPAKKIVDMFVEHGGEIFKKRWTWFGLWQAPYSAHPLATLLDDEGLFGDRLLGHCKHPVIVPAINYSTGKPVIFKTPHHENFRRDHTFRLVDVALATSAAPAYFPRHCFGDSQYVDGGLFANAPGLLANHEALSFLGQSQDGIWMLSVGTMSAKFTVDPRGNRRGGALDWGGLNPLEMPRRLFGMSISVQESLIDFILRHRLLARYQHLDDELTERRAGAVALDKATPAAREVLRGAAKERSKFAIGDPIIRDFLAHAPATPIFFHGPNAAKE